MNIVTPIKKHQTLTLLIALMLFVGGLISYLKLNTIEEPILIQRNAIITTHYPGASPREVENDVTDLLETALKQLPFIHHISSLSSQGKSIINVQINPNYPAKKLPQAWQLLKDKAADLQNHLPINVEKPIVDITPNEVYGILLAMTGNGFSDTELKHYSELLKQKISIIPGVQKTITWGEQIESINLYFPQTQVAQLNISENSIYSKLKHPNTITSAGNVLVDNQEIHIRPLVKNNPLEEIGNVVIHHQSNQVVHLNDIADISKGHLQPTNTLMRFNMNPAVGLAISLDPKNISQTGDAIKQKIQELKSTSPSGIEIEMISFQPNQIKFSIKQFDKIWLISLCLIIITLILTLGIRSGLIQALVLLITFSTLLIILYLLNIELQQVSYGALIITFCLLLDNSLIINQKIIDEMHHEKGVLSSAIDVVNKNGWLLFAGTIICILALTPLKFLSHTTSEYFSSFFIIFFFALLLSWISAITITPLLCTLFLKKENQPSTSIFPIRNFYSKVLNIALSYRLYTILLSSLLLILMLVAFQRIPHSFFPRSDQPQFLLHYWLPQGSQIDLTSQQLQQIEKNLIPNKAVESISTFVGGGAPKFLANYSPEILNSSYGLQIVKAKNYRDLNSLIIQTKQYILDNFPDAKVYFEKIKLGPTSSNLIKARFSGPDDLLLRQLAEQALNIYQQYPGLQAQTNWRNPTPVIYPDLDEVGVRTSGISKMSIANALKEAFSGREIGTYQEQNHLIPIVAYRTFDDRRGLDNLYDIMLWSPVIQKSISIQQVINGIEMIWENPFIFRNAQIHSIDVQSHAQEMDSTVFNQIKKKIQKMTLPEGYYLNWEGEHEDIHQMLKQLMQSLPLIGIIIFLILVFIFNELKKPFIILLALPFSLIGITLGLLLAGMPFGFMSLLGLLIIMGILIKSSMILLYQQDNAKYSLSELIPSFTQQIGLFYLTLLVISVGSIPLIMNAFFKEIAITLIFGLMTTAILISLILPGFYSLAMGINKKIIGN